MYNRYLNPNEQHDLALLVLLEPYTLPELLLLFALPQSESHAAALAMISLQYFIHAAPFLAIGTLVDEAHEELGARLIEDKLIRWSSAGDAMVGLLNR